MRLELDHFFILTKPGAPEANLLTNIGLIEGSANDHLGQGTSNRRFFFADSMLELLYIRDTQEAKNEPGCRLHLVERAANETASPFGLVFRAADDSAFTSFLGWKYHPKYMDAVQHLCIAENSDRIEEPLCILMPDSSSRAARLSNAGPFDYVTEVRICLPSEHISPVLESIGECRRLSLISGEQHLMEVIFNGGRDYQSRDLRPSLPLIVRW